MNGRSKLGWLAALIAIGGATIAGAGERCETASIRGPLVLPDGSLHQAETVQVCRTLEYSPVLTLHKISVDGRPVGLFVGRDARLESGHDETPYLLLERDASGRLELRGYAAHGSMHDFAPRAVEAPTAVQATWQIVARS